MKTRRILSVFLILLFMLSIMGGCQEASPAETTTAEETNETTEETTARPEGPSWTWDTSPIELDWYFGENWYEKNWDTENCWFDNWIKEKTGIEEITVIVSPSGDQETLITSIASKSLQDAITISPQPATVKYHDMLIDGGLVFPFFEMIDKYAPDFRDAIPQSMVEFHSYSDGEFYGLVNFVKAPEHEDPRSEPGLSYNIVARKDIMDELGITLEDFSTQDKFVETLIKVKDAKLKSPSDNDIKPFMISSIVKDPAEILGWHSNCFGGGNEDKDGNFIEKIQNPAYLEAAKFLNRLYREGLLTKDNLILKKKSIEAEIINGGIFMFMGNVFGSGNYFKDGLKDYGAEIISIPPPQSTTGGKPAFEEEMLMGWTSTMIPKTSRYPDRVIRLLELLYSEEGQIALQHGEEGVHHEIREDSDGFLRAFWTDEFKAIKETMKDDEIRATYGFDTFWPAINGVSFMAWRPRNDTPEDRMMRAVKNTYLPYLYPGDYTSALKLNPKSEDEEKEIQEKIALYLGDNVMQMVVAESEEKVEEEYQRILSKLEEMGLSKLVAYKNAKYQEAKEKGGIDFIHPNNK